MRVLVLGWEYPPAVAGGLGAACHGLTTALADRGHEIVLATPYDGAAPPPAPYPGIARVALGEYDGVATGEAMPLNPYACDPDPVETGPGGPSSERAGASRKLYGGDLSGAIQRYTRDAVARLGDVKFDVVHAHDWMTFPAALRLRFTHQRPVCVHVHSTAYDRGGSARVGGPGSIAAVERAGVLTADLVCAVSAYTRDVLVRHGADPFRGVLASDADFAWRTVTVEGAERAATTVAADQVGGALRVLGAEVAQGPAGPAFQAPRDA